MTPGSCRFCQCTETAACEGGCSWADDARTVCSQCASAAAIADTFLLALARVPVAEGHVPVARFSSFSVETQTALVTTCREVSASWVTATADALSDDAQDALAAAAELDRIALYLATRARHELRDRESISGMVMRLLEPHVGSGLVLPPGVTV